MPRPITFAFAILVLLALVLPAGSVQGDPSKLLDRPIEGETTLADVWLVHTVDSAGVVGSHASLVLDGGDYPFISYYDASQGDLKLAYRDAAGWHTGTVDSVGDVGRYSSLSRSPGAPGLAIAYYDAGNGDLKLALSYDGGQSWQVETGDSFGDVGQYASLYVDWAGGSGSRIAYYDATGADLRYAHRDGSGSWETTTVASAGDVGSYSELAWNGAQGEIISFYDGTHRSLWRAHRESWSDPWQLTEVYSDALGADAGRYSSVAIYDYVSFWISFYDQTNGDLRATNCDGCSGWLVDGGGGDDVGQYTSLRLSRQGNDYYPHVAYYDATDGDLRYAHYDGSWHTEAVDTSGKVGPYASLQLDAIGYPHIAYYDAQNADLKYAYLCKQPVAGFQVAPAPVCQGQPVSFENSTQGSRPGLAYSWDFGDGITSTLQSPVHTYAGPGPYYVILQAGNECGSDLEVQPVVVHRPPEAGFTYGPAPACAGQEVGFTNTTVASGTVAYTWDFGDGLVSTATHPLHTFASPGRYSVTLTATNLCATDVYTAELAVHGPPNAAFAYGPGPLCAGAVVTFSNSSVASGTLSFRWDFGDGTMSTLVSPTHVYTNAANFAVTLTATNACASDWATETLSVHGAPWGGRASWDPPTVLAGYPATFSASVTSTLPLSYTWDFGDGGRGEGEVLTHTYAATGSYALHLTMTGGCGQQAVSATVAVVPCAKPTGLEIDYNPRPPLAGRDTVFSATLAAGSEPFDFLWTFGDLGSGSGQVVSHTYTAPGTYDVLVRAENACGHAVQTATVSVVPPRYEIYVPLITRDHYGGDAFEPDDTPAWATEIYLDVPQRHDFHRQGDTDWVRILLNDTAYRFETADLTGEADTWIYLYWEGQYGAPLAENDDCTGLTRASCITYTPEVPGWYYLRVENIFDAWGREVGYTLRVVQD